jgi:hypothetical protein
MMDGGSVFPTVNEDTFYGRRSAGGMTLRDYFAGQALAGMLAGQFMPKCVDVGDWNYSTAAYRMADLTLKARGE